MLLSLLANGASAGGALPHLEQHGTTKRLIVDDKPFLILGGELGNSAAEPDYLRQFWPKLKDLKLNTLVVPVYWNLIEPTEGRFDFATVDGLLPDARAHDMRLVLLWFGSWKNSMSCYAPEWLKTDTVRFPRTIDRTGRPMEILSAFSRANSDADARAFRALMKHLREIDGQEHTVVMVQVENEIGMIPDSRDFSTSATELLRGEVPSELLQGLAAADDTIVRESRDVVAGTSALPTSGTWSQIFGQDTAGEEVFTAWHFAKYVQAVAEAGKAEYALPMFVNAALIRPTYVPGQYPAGGPLPHLFGVWRAGAPAIEFFSPDIYFPNFAEWCLKYSRDRNPLFIPEAMRSADASVNALFAIGECGAIGFCPFGIESVAEGPAQLLAESYDTLHQLTPLILTHVGRGSMKGLLAPAAEQRQPHQLRLGGYVLSVTYERGAPPSLADGVIVPDKTAAPAAPPPSGGLVIQLAPDEFLIAGMGATVTFASPEAGEVVGLLSAQEGNFLNGKWQPKRSLNGDETHQGRHVRLEPARFGIQRIRLYKY